ncbi:helix-turn-helix transcriptional regulator [Pseudomonas sp. KU26590]|uniref:helix-turn-helix domain-containing protein n=1 Tax=Pseudomonas sp. KU26590 TaxID=2991051 RepID=UPI002AC8932A|nr:helix-turn-helix transcriptional regulator [Pseudomonas sp. KU26590]
MEKLGTRLRKERKRLGLTQIAFARIGGVEPNAQGHYESGHRSPKADYLQRVCDAGVDMHYLFSGNSLIGLVDGLDADDRSLPTRTVLSSNRDVIISNRNAVGILGTLHQSLDDTTQVIVDVATCFSTRHVDSREEQFAAQVRDFQEDSRRFIGLAMMKVQQSA